ncbi:MAG: hypothetical protein JRE40_04650 [Deltaproteobacteria bacterium]|nr:hypothetical protein [Deltaproteobacteria bacterium]
MPEITRREWYEIKCEYCSKVFAGESKSRVLMQYELHKRIKHAGLP